MVIICKTQDCIAKVAIRGLVIAYGFSAQTRPSIPDSRHDGVPSEACAEDSGKPGVALDMSLAIIPRSSPYSLGDSHGWKKTGPFRSPLQR